MWWALLRAGSALVASIALVLACGVEGAAAAASYRAHARADLELVPRMPGRDLVVVETYSGRELLEAPPAAPGIAFSHDGSAVALRIAESVFLEASVEGSVAGRRAPGEAGEADGGVLAWGRLGLVNERDTPFPIDVRVTLREFGLDGAVSDDGAELARAVLLVSFVGNRLEGLPTDGVFYEDWPSTRDDDPPTGPLRPGRTPSTTSASRSAEPTASSCRRPSPFARREAPSSSRSTSSTSDWRSSRRATPRRSSTRRRPRASRSSQS